MKTIWIAIHEHDNGVDLAAFTNPPSDADLAAEFDHRDRINTRGGFSHWTPMELIDNVEPTT